MKNASENVVCWSRLLYVINAYISIQTNSVDPDQTAPFGVVWSVSILFATEMF